MAKKRRVRRGSDDDTAVIRHSPDPKKYHAPDSDITSRIGMGRTGRYAVIPAGKKDGSSAGFKAHEASPVIVDPDKPGGGFIFDPSQFTPEQINSAFEDAVDSPFDALADLVEAVEDEETGGDHEGVYDEDEDRFYGRTSRTVDTESDMRTVPHSQGVAKHAYVTPRARKDGTQAVPQAVPQKTRQEAPRGTKADKQSSRPPVKAPTSSSRVSEMDKKASKPPQPSPQAVEIKNMLGEVLEGIQSLHGRVEALETKEAAPTRAQEYRERDRPRRPAAPATLPDEYADEEDLPRTEPPRPRSRRHDSDAYPDRERRREGKPEKGREKRSAGIPDREQLEAGLSSLNVSWLKSKGGKAGRQVVFSIPNAGRSMARYHDVIDAPHCLVLIYDTRYEGGQQYEPPDSLGDTAIEVQLVWPQTGEDKAPEPVTYRVISAGLNFSFGVFDIIVLAKIPAYEVE